MFQIVWNEYGGNWHHNELSAVVAFLQIQAENLIKLAMGINAIAAFFCFCMIERKNFLTKCNKCFASFAFVFW